MTGLQLILRILLSVGVFFAGFGNAMPLASAAERVSPSHCEEHAAQSAQQNTNGATAHAVLALRHHDAGKGHPKANCCKSGGCPCAQVVAGLRSSGFVSNAVSLAGIDFRAPVSGYRSPSLARLVRPPIG